MTRPHNHDRSNWSVRLERDSPARPRDPGRDRWRGFRVFVMSTFLVHLIVFLAIMMMLTLINLLTWSGTVWVIFPLVSWGALLVIHGGVTWLTATTGVSGRMVDRLQRPVAQPPVRPGTPETDLAAIVHDGLAKVDDIRTIARNMRHLPARREGADIASVIESTLLVLEERSDELPFARQYHETFITPSWRIFVEYGRLRDRGVASVDALLAEVEEQDLPRIHTRASQVFERVNRGTIIDLQVAREMLQLDNEESALSSGRGTV